MDAGVVLGVVLGVVFGCILLGFAIVFWPKGRAQTSLKVRQPNWERREEIAAAKLYAKR